MLRDLYFFLLGLAGAICLSIVVGVLARRRELHLLRYKLFRFAARKWILLPLVDNEKARTSAGQRREFLRSNGIPDTLPRSSFETPLTFREILEVPAEGVAGGFPERLVPSGRDLGRGEAAAQLASLVWQIRDDAFLLLGRTIDLVTLICRTTEGELERSVKQISLCKIKGISSSSGYDQDPFPFYIVLQTHEPSWKYLLEPYREWLGIGVLVQPPTNIIQLGRCSAGKPSEEGKAGGYLAFNQEYLQITCSHVIAPGCQSEIFRSVLVTETMEPDIAIIRGWNPCFSSLFKGERVFAIDEGRSSFYSKREFFRVPGRHHTGVLETVVGWVNYENRIHKFPHALVLPKIQMVLDFKWPPWRVFSSKGDSGSWIVESNSQQWLGVLVAGNRTFRHSYVALAKPALDYLRLAAQLDPNFEPFREMEDESS